MHTHKGSLYALSMYTQLWMLCWCYQNDISMYIQLGMHYWTVLLVMFPMFAHEISWHQLFLIQAIYHLFPIHEMQYPVAHDTSMYMQLWMHFCFTNAPISLLIMRTPKHYFNTNTYSQCMLSGLFQYKCSESYRINSI